MDTSRSTGTWALIVFALGWGPVCLLVGLNAFFGNLIDNTIVAVLALGVAPLCTFGALVLGAHHFVQEWRGGSRFRIPRSTGAWAVIIFVLGWAPLFLLDPLNSLFDHPISHQELVGWGMALGLGVGPLCTIIALVLGVHRLWRGLMGDDSPPARLNLRGEVPESHRDK